MLRIAKSSFEFTVFYGCVLAVKAAGCMRKNPVIVKSDDGYKPGMAFGLRIWRGS